MWDSLLEQDPRIRQLRATSREEGQEEGREEGREEGISAMQNAIMNILNKRFPDLALMAKADVERIRQFESLYQLVAEISVAQNEPAAQRAIAAYQP